MPLPLSATYRACNPFDFADVTVRFEQGKPAHEALVRCTLPFEVDSMTRPQRTCLVCIRRVMAAIGRSASPRKYNVFLITDENSPLGYSVGMMSGSRAIVARIEKYDVHQWEVAA